MQLECMHEDLITMVKERIQMVWSHLDILWNGKSNSAGDNERSKKERKTEEEMGTSKNGQELSLEIL